MSTEQPFPNNILRIVTREEYIEGCCRRRIERRGIDISSSFFLVLFLSTCSIISLSLLFYVGIPIEILPVAELLLTLFVLGNYYLGVLSWRKHVFTIFFFGLILSCVLFSKHPTYAYFSLLHFYILTAINFILVIELSTHNDNLLV